MLYTLENDRLKVELSSLGATITKFIDKATNTDIVLGFDTEEEYIENRGVYIGTTIARSSNRIGGGKFKLNGEEYTLALNDGPNNLHSGEGISCTELDLYDQTENSITFSYTLKDGYDGFPGNLFLKIQYELISNRLVILYTAISDKDTIFNVTNHSYFNLDGGKNDALNHELKINTNKVAVGDENTLALDETRDVTGTAFDFLDFRNIGENIKIGDDNLSVGGIDHNYSFENLNHKELLTLRNDKLSLTMSSDLPDLQVYTSNCLGDRKGKYGNEYHKYWGVALEPQFYPNAINYGGFLKPILKANEEIRHHIVYEIDKR